MKMCNTEVMKKVKLLEQAKGEILAEESRIHWVTYQTKMDKFDNGYDFAQTRKKVDDIEAEIRMYKRLLNLSNATTMVDAFDMTLGECLVYMAQLNRQVYTLEAMSRKEPITRYSTHNGVIEFTELNYDKAECQERLRWVLETISKLQIAIDRANLTNIIEIE